MLSNMFHKFEEEEFIFFLSKQNENLDVLADKVAAEVDNRGASPVAIPAREFKHYRKIQNLRKKHLSLFVAIWEEAKPLIADAYARENGISLNKGFIYKQNRSLDSIFFSTLKKFKDQATKAFGDGIVAGNAYFQDMFKVKGLDNKQIKVLQKDYTDVFEVKSKDLYQNQVVNKLDNRPTNTLQNILDVLGTFDRFLLGIAGMAIGVAYDLFANATDALNNDLEDVGQFGVKPFAVQWVLGDPKTSHSPDCLMMSRGNFTLNSEGVWDPEELAATGLTPGSFLLDCGGKCLCHLHPIFTAKNSDIDANFAESLAVPVIRNEFFKITTNMTKQDFRNLVTDKGWEISPNMQELLLESPQFRRREFWENIPEEGVDGHVGFNFIQTEIDTWSVNGLTNIRGKGKNAKPTQYDVNILVPKGVNIVNGDISLDQIPEVAKIHIKHVAGHELAHTMMFSVPEGAQKALGGNKILSNVFDKAAAKRIQDGVNKEYTFQLAKMESQLKDLIQNSDVSNLSEELRDDIAFLSTIANGNEDFTLGDIINDLYLKIREGASYELVVNGQIEQFNPNSILAGFTQTLKKMGIGDDLISFYQLYDKDEYWAEFMGLFLNAPERARINNERLFRLVEKEFKQFGESTLPALDVLPPPNSTLINQLENIPDDSNVVPAPPNASFEELFDSSSIVSNTSTLTATAGFNQVEKVFEEFTNLSRTDFFDGTISVVFESRTSMFNRTGDARNVSVFNSDSGELLINADLWKDLSIAQRADIFSGVAADNISKAFISDRFSIVEDYTGILFNVFNSLNMKFTRQGLKEKAKGNFDDVIDALFKDDLSDLTINSEEWEEIFDKIFYPALRNFTDLPANDARALRNSESFFKDFMKNYIINPKIVGQAKNNALYNKLLEVLEVEN